MKTIDQLHKAAESDAAPIGSYRGGEGDQRHDMGARAAMEDGRAETPHPSKPTGGEFNATSPDADDPGKYAAALATAPETAQPVPTTPSQSVLTAKKISPASLPVGKPAGPNRLRFGSPFSSTQTIGGSTMKTAMQPSPAPAAPAAPAMPPAPQALPQASDSAMEIDPLRGPPPQAPWAAPAATAMPQAPPPPPPPPSSSAPPPPLPPAPPALMPQVQPLHALNDQMRQQPVAPPALTPESPEVAQELQRRGHRPPLAPEDIASADVNYFQHGGRTASGAGVDARGLSSNDPADSPAMWDHMKQQRDLADQEAAAAKEKTLAPIREAARSRPNSATQQIARGEKTEADRTRPTSSLTGAQRGARRNSLAKRQKAQADGIAIRSLTRRGMPVAQAQARVRAMATQAPPPSPAEFGQTAGMSSQPPPGAGPQSQAPPQPQSPADFGADQAAGSPSQPTSGAGPQSQAPPPPPNQPEIDWREDPSITGTRSTLPPALQADPAAGPEAPPAQQEDPLMGSDPPGALPAPPADTLMSQDTIPGQMPPGPDNVTPDPLMSPDAIPGQMPTGQGGADQADPSGVSDSPNAPGEAPGAPAAPTVSGAWDALKSGDIAGAWSQAPDWLKGVLGGGGGAILMLLLMKLFGKRGEASYSPAEIDRARNILDRMVEPEKLALWGQAAAQPDMIEKAACAMTKRYSKTKRVKRASAAPGSVDAEPSLGILGRLQELQRWQAGARQDTSPMTPQYPKPIDTAGYPEGTTGEWRQDMPGDPGAPYPYFKVPPSSTGEGSMWQKLLSGYRSMPIAAQIGIPVGAAGLGAVGLHSLSHRGDKEKAACAMTKRYSKTKRVKQAVGPDWFPGGHAADVYGDLVGKQPAQPAPAEPIKPPFYSYGGGANWFSGGPPTVHNYGEDSNWFSGGPPTAPKPASPPEKPTSGPPPMPFTSRPPGRSGGGLQDTSMTSAKPEAPVDSGPALAGIGGPLGAIGAAWSRMPEMAQGAVAGVGGVALLAYVLSKLYGERDKDEYTPEETNRGIQVLQQMPAPLRLQLAAEVQQGSPAVKMGCAMAKRYSRTHKPGRGKGRRGQFQGGNKFQGATKKQKTAEAFGKLAASDIIPGGRADNQPASDFAAKAVAAGKKVELEHTDNPSLAQEITEDHLSESGKYYTALDKMEKGLKKDGAQGYAPDNHSVTALLQRLLGPGADNRGHGTAPVTTPSVPGDMTTELMAKNAGHVDCNRTELAAKNAGHADCNGARSAAEFGRQAAAA